MSGQSNIIRIIDFTAYVAGQIEGVKSVAAAGQGYYDDPLREGLKIEAAGETPTTAYAHWSEIPNAPPVEFVSQSGTVEIVWTIPMRLWLPKTNLEARRTALPFYDRYLRAFITNWRLDDQVLRSNISKFHIDGDKDWSWLDIGLIAVERVSYGS